MRSHADPPRISRSAEPVGRNPARFMQAHLTDSESREHCNKMSPNHGKASLMLAGERSSDREMLVDVIARCPFCDEPSADGTPAPGCPFRGEVGCPMVDEPLERSDDPLGE